MTKICLLSDLHYGFDSKTHIIISDFFNRMKAKKPDILLIAGDIISHMQCQWRGILKILRTYFPEIPILIVKGNHDYWDGDYSFGRFCDLAEFHRRMFHDYNVTYLETEHYETDELVIYGFDGWYGSTEPPSNDTSYIGEVINGTPMHRYMWYKGWIALNNIPFKTKKKTIIVSHFELNTHSMGGDIALLPDIKSKADIFCVGHSHQEVNTTDGELQIYNCGSDYNKPNYILFEV